LRRYFNSLSVLILLQKKIAHVEFLKENLTSEAKRRKSQKKKILNKISEEENL
jgi:hypothetical protein